MVSSHDDDDDFHHITIWDIAEKAQIGHREERVFKEWMDGVPFGLYSSFERI